VHAVTDAPTDPQPGQRIYRHSIAARTAHWLWTFAMLVLVMSGLQIFNAAPYLDASYKTDPAHRVLAFDAHTGADNQPVGTTTLFGHTFVTTHLFGSPTTVRAARARARFPHRSRCRPCRTSPTADSGICSSDGCC
jgi:hypothetical protein